MIEVIRGYNAGERDIKRRFSILHRYDRNKHGNIGTTTGFVMQAAVIVDILVPIIDDVFPA